MTADIKIQIKRDAKTHTYLILTLKEPDGLLIHLVQHKLPQAVP
jgi:hypothetical protein